jgi:virulence-associated protein VapD
MYAIRFALRVDDVKGHYPGKSYNNAYKEIRKILEEHGFTRVYGPSCIYFADRVNEKRCRAAVQAVIDQLPWFLKCLSELRIQHIKKDIDLIPELDYKVRS